MNTTEPCVHDHHASEHNQHHPSPSTRDIFTSSSIRCTKPRLLIYEALCATKSHPTAEELHTAVRESDPGISLATIYNTLELLVDHGLARRIANRCPGSGASRYEADHTPHLHLVLNDGRVLDAPSDLSKQLNDAIPEGLMQQLAQHAGVKALKIEIIEDTHASHPEPVTC
ncbi:MAG: transcriptional repressor [Phycisphaerales bacterium]|nr:transcriptional repressor [Phycisphaerales bacterium]